MQVSDKGVEFISLHEGFVSRAYLDPVGVLTIGIGFTNASRVFTDYWIKKHGRKMKMGDTITRKDALKILKRMIDEEYGAAVNRRFVRHLEQHEHDASSSFTFNLGPGSLKWKWATALDAGDIKLAAQRMRVTGTTARGKKLPGLVRRRKEEAKLLEHGVYTGVDGEGTPRHVTNKKPPAKDPVIEEVQELLKNQGFDPGRIDGWMGPATKKAVLSYQKTHPNLDNDGIIGPATIAQLRRDALAVRDGAIGAPTVAGGGLLSFLTGLPYEYIIPALIVAGVAIYVYYNWTSIKRWFNQIRGAEVA